MAAYPARIAFSSIIRVHRQAEILFRSKSQPKSFIPARLLSRRRDVPEIWKDTKLKSIKYLNNIIEQGHGGVALVHIDCMDE